MPFRDLQCALYNGRPVLGTQEAYRWVPFYGGEQSAFLLGRREQPRAGREKWLPRTKGDLEGFKEKGALPLGL